MTQSLRIGRPLKVALAAALLAALTIDPWYVTGVLQSQPDPPDLADFNVFYLAGQMILSGHFADAYKPSIMASLETALAHGHPVFMPWSYPPILGFLVAPLAALPLWLSYLVFTSATLALFCAVLRRLGGAEVWPVILATAPVLLINIRAGQNGMLSGGLCGLAALYLLQRRPVAAGSAMGCLVFKPHLAPVLPLMLVMQKRWLTLAAAALGGLALTGLSIAVFGPAVFSAFLGSTLDTGRYILEGAYPLHRMTSLYGFALSIGAPAPVAAALHAALALALLGWTAWTLHIRRDLRVQIGVSAAACAFVSPYFMDYDQTIFAVGLVLLAPALNRTMAPNRYGLLLFFIAIAQTLGIAAEALGWTASLGGPVLFAAYLVMLLGVYRDGARGQEAAPPPAMAAPLFSGSTS